MFDCFGTGFSSWQLVIVTTVIYLLLLGMPIAVTYVATGRSKLFSKQVQLSMIAIVILLTGGFIVYGPAISYIVIAFAIINFLCAIYAVVNRSTIK